MTIKETWTDGEVFTSADENAIASEVNAHDAEITTLQSNEAADDATVAALAAKVNPTTSFSEYIGTVNGSNINVVNQAIPTGAVGATVTIIPPGGAGGSGAVQDSGTVATGGGGGGSVCPTQSFNVPKNALGTLFSVFIQTAPAGGAEVGPSAADGNAGATGSSYTTKFSTDTGFVLFGQAGGSGGGGGAGVAGKAGLLGAIAAMYTPGSAGAASSAAGGVGVSSAGGQFGGGTGGGSGAGLAATPVAANGGAANLNFTYGTAAAAGGTTAGVAPQAGSPARAGICGTGAGGGASSTTGNGQAGADATSYGGGGGGGGAALTGHTSGRGGNGGPGYIHIKWLYS